MHKVTCAVCLCCAAPLVLTSRRARLRVIGSRLGDGCLRGAVLLNGVEISFLQNVLEVKDNLGQIE